MVEIPRAKPGKLHLAGEHRRHRKLRQFADMPADGSVEQVNACRGFHQQLTRRERELAATIARGYFVTIRRVGVTVLVGAMGEIANVSQTFHPEGRFSAANSP